MNPVALIQRTDVDDLQWYVPAGILPEELQRCIDVIRNLLENPVDLEGKKPQEMLNKTKKRTRARRYVEGEEAEGEEAESRKARRRKEEKEYKSAQFIKDSDFDPEEDAKFYTKERELRERAKKAALEGGQGSLMLSTGTKKRKKVQAAREKSKNVRRKRNSDEEDEERPEEEAQAESSPSEEGSDGETTPPPKPRPRAVPRRRHVPFDVGEDEAEPASAVASTNAPPPETNGNDMEDESAPVLPKPRRRTQAVVVSDEEE